MCYFMAIGRIVCRAFFSAQKGCGCARFFTPTVFEFFSAIRIVLSSVIVFVLDCGFVASWSWGVSFPLGRRPGSE